MDATAASAVVVERLLDRYPLDEDELRRLLACRQEDLSSLEGVVVAASGTLLGENGNDLRRIREGEDDEGDVAAPVTPEDADGRRRGGILSSLPELSDLYRRALAKVFVVPSSLCANEAFDDPAPSSGGSNGAEKQKTATWSAMELETSLEAICTLLGRRGAGNGQQFLWDVLFESFQEEDTEEKGGEAGDCDHEPREAEAAADRDALMSFLYRVGLVAMAASSSSSSSSSSSRQGWNKLSPIRDGKVDVPQGWIQSLSPGKPKVSRSEWNAWTAGNHLYRCVSTAFHAALQFRPRSPPIEFPPSNLFPSPLERMALAAMGALGGGSGGGRRYHPDLLLYDSDRDGLSFRLLQHALLGFYGPTLLVVRTTDGDCWGYRTGLPWKASKSWYTAGPQGDDNGTAEPLEESCYLFRLSPKWNKYRMVPSSSTRRPSPYHQYLNVEASHQPQNRALKGLAVGGVAPDAPRMYLTDTLESCRCSPVDQLFEAGPILSDDNGMYFDADRILLFAACDPPATPGSSSLSSPFEKMRSMGQRQVQHMESARIRVAKVDRTQFAEDAEQFTSLFAHRDQARGRCDFVAMDDESMGYYVRGKQPSTRTILSPALAAAAERAPVANGAQLKRDDDAELKE